jgi:HTH-type transcriptional regulator, competence development regulator
MAGLVPRPHRPQLEARHRRFGEYVRQARLAKRMTLRRCAEAIGLAPGHLSNVENFRVGPPDEPTLIKLAEVLEVPVGARLCRAGRFSPEALQRFWASPLIPALVISSTGWTPEEASIFQETVRASLAPSPGV